LDYIYDFQLGGANLTTETAVPMSLLGDYFRVQSLVDEATDFIKKDLDSNNAHLYYQDGLLYHDKLLCDASMDTAAMAWQSFVDLPTDSNDGQPPVHPMMAVLTPEQQTDLLKRALAESAKEFRRFKALPLACDRKKLHGCPALPSTSMPTGCENHVSGGYTVDRRNSEDLGTKVACPIFYFDIR
jgi:hypothetical protein